MGFRNDLTDELITFISKQHIFFTGTAPNSGRINVSPKGMDSFRCFDHQTVGYLDLTGSGNETAAHIYENGRFTIMFCSFDKEPLILRLYGKGEVVSMNSDKWNERSHHFPDYNGQRQIILLHIEHVQESCGYAIPFMEFKSERSQLDNYWGQRDSNSIEEYQKQKNLESIDGLPTHLFD